MRVNIGCGQTPTDGWENFDNSPATRWPGLLALLGRLGLLHPKRREYAEFCRTHRIRYADARRHIPLHDGAADALYTSHMLEHLTREEAAEFLNEARRVLQPGGILRVAVPNVRVYVDNYLESGDADTLIDHTHLTTNERTFWQHLRTALVGTRHHRWLYDGKSLTALIDRCGFRDARVMPAGHTRIPNHGALNLHERASHTVYVEALK